MNPTEVKARRAAGKCIACGHGNHPTDRCGTEQPDPSKAQLPGVCGCLAGVEDLLVLDELEL
ncbi:hypothetical protein [Streptomyces sp. NPDC001340]